MISNPPTPHGCSDRTADARRCRDAAEPQGFSGKVEKSIERQSLRVTANVVARPVAVGVEGDPYWQSQYFNRIEQDHRRIKRRIRPMLGFKSMTGAAIILSGVETVHMMRKRQARYAYNPAPSLGERFEIPAT